MFHVTDPSGSIQYLGYAKGDLLTLRQLRYFLSAIDLGSFTAVAAHMHLTQPAVADQIRQLERHLGVQLFVRLGRGLRLTDAGAEFAVYAQRVIAASEEAEESVADLRTLRSGTMTFGAFGAPAHYQFADLIKEFVTRFPGIKLRVRGRNSSVTADDVREGELEAALVVLPIDDTGLSVRPVARDEVLFASADPASTRQPVSVEDFVRRPIVLYETQYAFEDPTRRQLAARTQALGLSIEGRIEVEHLETALQLVAHGLGNTYVPQAVTKSAAFPGNISTCSFAPRMYDAFALITRRGSRVSAPIAEFMRLVESHMRLVASGFPHGAVQQADDPMPAAVRG
ncbi:LysR family transcriptional regulator [Amycolatopsis sulphurea]|uniref:LysR family transcriptional regulator n=1 Tax=Amycolatopsis sulphurea TaxID=76022 RepID=UPI000BF60DAE|nr:LysR family transcriptional regulator [Amycolatopsis sulphurea]